MGDKREVFSAWVELVKEKSQISVDNEKRKKVVKTLKQLTFVNKKNNSNISSQLNEDCEGYSSSDSSDDENCLKIPFEVREYNSEGRIPYIVEGQDGKDYIIEYEETSEEYMVFENETYNEGCKAFGYLDPSMKNIVVI